MIGTLLKLFAYAEVPKRTFAVLHPKKAAKTVALPWEMGHAYGPRVAALVTAAVIGPLAYRIGRRIGREEKPAAAVRTAEIRIEPRE